MNKCISESTDGLVKEKMNVRMNEWIYESINDGLNKRNENMQAPSQLIFMTKG